VAQFVTAAYRLTDTQAIKFLSEKLEIDPSYPVDQVWRVLKVWLVHFYAETYRLETGQEVLIKGKKLPR
jgi:hypothetical protein